MNMLIILGGGEGGLLFENKILKIEYFIPAEPTKFFIFVHVNLRK